MAERREEWVFRARVRVLAAKGQIGLTKMEAVQAAREMDRLYRLHKKAADHYVEVHELEDV